MKLKDAVAVVTGGASGLGRAAVEKFIAEGAKVAILDLSDAAGQELADQLGDAALYVSANVTDEASVTRALDEVVSHFGALHLCFNCAGIGNAVKTLSKTGPFPLADFNKVLQVNLVGSFNVLRLAAERMARNQPNEDGECGVVLNTASVAAYEGQIGQAAYSASKGGVVGMTLPIARDLASYGIRVNTIVPGLFLTPLFQSLGEEVVDALGRQVLFPQRLGRPAEVAQLAASVIENPYINGECIRIDGGIRMQAR